MSGTYINVEKLKEFVDLHQYRANSLDHKYIARRNRIFDTCVDRGNQLKDTKNIMLIN